MKRFLSLFTGLIWEAVGLLVILVVILLFQQKAASVLSSLTADQRSALGEIALAVVSALLLIDLGVVQILGARNDKRLTTELADLRVALRDLEEETRALSKTTAGNGPASVFVTADQLISQEGRLQAGDVFVYAPSLECDLTPEFIASIGGNMARGIKYHYFLPNTADQHGDFEQLKREVSSVAGRAHATLIDVHWLPQSLARPVGLTIHSSETGGKPSCRGFATIPQRKWESQFFIKMDQTYASRGLHYLKALAEKVDIKD